MQPPAQSDGGGKRQIPRWVLAAGAVAVIACICIVAVAVLIFLAGGLNRPLASESEPTPTVDLALDKTRLSPQQQTREAARADRPERTRVAMERTLVAVRSQVASHMTRLAEAELGPEQTRIAAELTRIEEAFKLGAAFSLSLADRAVPEGAPTEVVFFDLEEGGPGSSNVGEPTSCDKLDSTGDPTLFMVKGEEILLLCSFSPEEKVRVVAYEASSGPEGHFLAWQAFQLNAAGYLIIRPELPKTFLEYRFLAIGDSSRQVEHSIDTGLAILPIFSEE